MATTYALPAMNGHGGHGHGHSHGRKSATERIPLRPTSTNGGLHINSGPISSDFLKHQVQHQPDNSRDVLYDSNQQSYNSNQQRPNSLQLPTPISFSTPTIARSKSMERRKSVGLPTHLRLERNGYGFPAPSSQQFPKIDEQVGKRFTSPVMHDLSLDLADNSSSKWMNVNEILNSILVPLPYVLASLAFTSLVATRASSDGLPLSSFAAPEVPVLLEISTMTSLTLLLVGLRGKIGIMSATGLDKRRRSLAGMEEVEKTQWTHMARRIAARFLTVGLPFYATSKLGGARVAVVILMALASNIMTVEEESTLLTQTKGWSMLLAQRRWTLVSTMLQLVLDLTGFTNSSAAVDIGLGYITLGIAVFVLPPCFLSSRPKVSVFTSTAPASESKTSAVLATPWEIPPQLEDHSSKVPAISPMICSPEDINLTFYSGIVVGTLRTIVFVFSGPSAGAPSQYQLAWSLLCAFATALALITVDPRSLRGNRNFGPILGLNFGFMIVQTFYGIMTGSLGLLSDSIHMFFDCLALVVGLCAAVMSKWPPSNRFPYGYGKMDTLAGFANGIFLMLISIEIVYEALERLAGGNQIHNLGELLTIIPMQVTSMKTTVHTMIILITTIHTTITLPTNMLITTIPTTTTAIMIIPLQDRTTHLTALMTIATYMIIFTRDQPRAPHSTPPYHQLPPNL
ncbi:MAG: Putative zinc transporter msc2 [Alectoria sarmentosa]|nr:MAG: Putative zinc transporter msc2 [Alectoria sarmentosa]